MTPEPHPVQVSARQRGIIDAGARYLPSRRPVVFAEMGFAASGRAKDLIERHTTEYRIDWSGPFNDRDHIPW